MQQGSWALCPFLVGNSIEAVLSYTVKAVFRAQSKSESERQLCGALFVPQSLGRVDARDAQRSGCRGQQRDRG
jgi:hypothetical protein